MNKIMTSLGMLEPKPFGAGAIVVSKINGKDVAEFNFVLTLKLPAQEGPIMCPGDHQVLFAIGNEFHWKLAKFGIDGRIEGSLDLSQPNLPICLRKSLQDIAKRMHYDFLFSHDGHHLTVRTHQDWRKGEPVIWFEIQFSPMVVKNQYSLQARLMKELEMYIADNR